MRLQGSRDKETDLHQLGAAIDHEIKEIDCSHGYCEPAKTSWNYFLAGFNNIFMAGRFQVALSFVICSCSFWGVTAWTSSSRPHHVHPHSLLQPTSSSSTSRIDMISNLFNNGGTPIEQQLPELPRDVKSAVSSCRSAVQAGLQQRLSRMDVEFPVGTKFGVEAAAAGKQKKRTNRDIGSDTPTTQDFQRSDRELARLFVDMFQPVGGENIVVAFANAESAAHAKQQWSGAECKIMSLDQRKVRAKQKKQAASGKGFAAKIAVELVNDDDDNVMSGPFRLPDNTEVALFVAPQAKELAMIEKICNQVGMGTLVILLNARLGKNQKFSSPNAEKLFLQEFEPVFSLTAAPQEVAPGCLVYRSFPGDWVLARKPKVGKPVSILSSANRFTAEECRQAYESIEVSDMEKGIDNVVDTLTGWLQ